MQAGTAPAVFAWTGAAGLLNTLQWVTATQWQGAVPLTALSCTLELFDHGQLLQSSTSSSDADSQMRRGLQHHAGAPCWTCPQAQRLLPIR